jgi:hypothetical protein
VNSETTLGCRLVPEEMNPTLFSVAAMPGMFIWASADETNRNKQIRMTFIQLLGTLGCATAEFRNVGF